LRAECHREGNRWSEKVPQEQSVAWEEMEKTPGTGTAVVKGPTGEVDHCRKMLQPTN